MTQPAAFASVFLRWLTEVAPKGGVLHNLALLTLFGCTLVAILVVKRAIDREHGEKRALKFS